MKSVRKNLHLLAVIIAIFPHLSHANTLEIPDFISSEFESMSQKRNIRIYLDETESFSSSQIVDLLKAGKFQFYDNVSDNIHRSSGTLWIYNNIKNDSNTSHDYFMYTHTSHYVWDLFLVKDDFTWEGPFQYGMDVDPDKRSIFSRHPGSVVSLDPLESKKFLIRVKTKYILKPTITVVSTDYFAKMNVLEHTLIALYYGLMLALICYNLFLFLSTKELSYLHYIFFAVSLCALLASSDGFADLFFGPFIFGSLSRYSASLHSLSLFCANNFIISLLQLKKEMRKSYDFFRLVGAILALIFFMTFLDIRVLADLSNVITVIICPIYLLIGIYLWKQGSKPAKYFIIGWGILIIGSFVSVLFPYFPQLNQGYRLYFIYIGSGLEIILMSFALGAKIGELELEKSLVEVKAREAEKLQKLVAILCHDIANPLNVILGQSYIAQKKQYSGEKLLLSWEKIKRASNIAVEIIQNVRDMEAIRTGKLNLKIGIVSINEAFENAEFIFEKQLENKKISLIGNLKGADEKFLVKAEKISFFNNIINNIISNAIKFSNQGDTIEFHAYKEEQYIRIEIRDHGIGMPKELCEQIFNEDSKTSRPGTMGEKGTGFGMPLAKSFVHVFSGKIQVESFPESKFPQEHGTKFTIHIPIAA